MKPWGTAGSRCVEAVPRFTFLTYGKSKHQQLRTILAVHSHLHPLASDCRRFQVEVSKVAREAGITFPVFLTRAVYDNYVTVPPALQNGKCGSHQDEAGRLWDIVW